MTTPLENIANLQTTEQALIAQLTTLMASPTTPPADITAIINQINYLSNARIGMFATLSENAAILQSGVSNSRVDLVSQMTLLNVVEDQINSAKAKLGELQNKNDTKMRMVQINTYYGQRYEAQSELMKLVIIVCIPILILFLLKKKGFLPEMIANYAIGITIAVSAIFVIRKVWNISMRSNMNYDEIDWKFEDPSDYSPTVLEYNKTHLFNFENPIKNLMGNLGFCMGADCCSKGLYFDEDKQKCTNVEKFDTLKLGGNLNGTAVVKFQETPNANGVAPYSSTADYAPISL